jgi:alginate O-acetyltransferase complex protein AlgI
LYLLGVSLFFYFKTSGVFVLLLLFTICSDHFWGKRIYKSDSAVARKIFLAISVTLNLLILIYFKYAYFFTESFNNIAGTDYSYFNHFAAFSNTFFSTNFNLGKLLLPVGVSFFTFQSLSYTIDLYRNRIKPVNNLFDYGFFVSFFPHIVAGPIVKAHDFVDQIYQPYKLSRHEFGMAVFWILNGFIKKIIADYLAINYIDRIFENPGLYSGLETCFGIFGYSLQIYMDFSGYTDIAIALALILGYRLKTNFNSPYKATSVGEFWKRWHISLSSWLLEYLYIPLGGNRKGTAGSYISITIILLFLILLSSNLWLLLIFAGIAVFLALISYLFASVRNSINTNINVMVTMLLGGLWHGSSWLFLIWGGLNGIGVVVHKLWSKISPFKNSENIFVKIVLMLITLVFISFTRIFFRSSDLETVQVLIDRMQNHWGGNLFLDVIVGYKAIFTLMLFGYLVHWIPEKTKIAYRNWFAKRPLSVIAIIAVVSFVLVYQIMSGEMQPFIYFQF